MTPAHEQHLRRVIERAANTINIKYRAGVREHVDLLSTLPTLTIVDHAIDEAVDQIIYLLTIREQLAGVK